VHRPVDAHITVDQPPGLPGSAEDGVAPDVYIDGSQNPFSAPTYGTILRKGGDRVIAVFLKTVDGAVAIIVYPVVRPVPGVREILGQKMYYRWPALVAEIKGFGPNPAGPLIRSQLSKIGEQLVDIQETYLMEDVTHGAGGGGTYDFESKVARTKLGESFAAFLERLWRFLLDQDLDSPGKISSMTEQEAQTVYSDLMEEYNSWGADLRPLQIDDSPVTKAVAVAVRKKVEAHKDACTPIWDGNSGNFWIALRDFLQKTDGGFENTSLTRYPLT